VKSEKRENQKSSHFLLTIFVVPLCARCRFVHCCSCLSFLARSKVTRHTWKSDGDKEDEEELDYSRSSSLSSFGSIGSISSDNFTAAQKGRRNSKLNQINQVR
jgi:hypothetical protein